MFLLGVPGVPVPILDCWPGLFDRWISLPDKAWFKSRILHSPNEILISLVDSNEYGWADLI